MDANLKRRIMYWFEDQGLNSWAKIEAMAMSEHPGMFPDKAVMSYYKDSIALARKQSGEADVEELLLSQLVVLNWPDSGDPTK